jgi:hypothetical protein
VKLKAMTIKPLLVLDHSLKKHAATNVYQREQYYGLRHKKHFILATDYVRMRNYAMSDNGH